MSIEYTYQVIKVDVAARCMEVAYSAPGHQTMRIGTRLPYADEELSTVIDMYAPIAHWIERAKPVAIPAVGTSGVVKPKPPEAPDAGTGVTFSVTEVV
jgi:hypothetical protein